MFKEINIKRGILGACIGGIVAALVFYISAYFSYEIPTFVYLIVGLIMGRVVHYFCELKGWLRV